METTTFDLTKLPEKYLPTIDNLKNDMQAIARSIEQDFPGYGVRIVLSMAKHFGGSPLYIVNMNSLARVWRDDTIRKMYDSGEYTAHALAILFKIGERQIWNILAEKGKGRE
ncbi:MAG: Mor transcription activator family protein [Desulfobulbus sp.]